MRQRRVPAGRLYDLLTLRGLTAPPVLVPEPAQGATVREEGRVFQIAVPRGAPARGRAGARVVIQEFADFQCPFSSRVQATLLDLELRYPGRIRIVWRHFPLPFHPDAMVPHEAAAEAHAQGHFWEYHDLLFANQRALSQGDLVRYAREVGLDVARFQAALDAHTHRATIEADLAASRESGATHGTPSFFIDGRLLQGAQQLSAFEAAVDAALRRR